MQADVDLGALGHLIPVLVQTGTLKVGDIDSAQKIIRIVQSKGRKDRNVMLPADILCLLRDWLKERLTGQDKGVPAPKRVLFPGYRGKHLSARQLSRLFLETAREAGITKRVTSHTLRHSFATHLLDNAADLNAVKTLLGHANLAATQIYTHQSVEKLKEIHRKTHPKG